MSSFAGELNAYLDYKIASGCKEQTYVSVFKQFDKFCADRGIRGISFTREDADAWSMKRDSEATTTHYTRVNTIKCFLEYVHLKGCDVFIPHDIIFKATDFKPHIYTDDEVIRYFHAVDTFCCPQRRLNEVQLPVIFRLMYCCGTRTNETIGIRKRDIDLDAGIVKLLETKNNNERYIVLGPELPALFRQYAFKSFYLFDDDDYVFSTTPGERRSHKDLYEIHRLILKQAGIPFVGGGEGPRVHDWRHTFAVRCFKRMIDQGMDMYVALPVLSTYLGHKTVYATERYVRLTMEIYPYIEEKFSLAFHDIFGKVTEQHETD